MNNPIILILLISTDLLHYLFLNHLQICLSLEMNEVF